MSSLSSQTVQNSPESPNIVHLKKDLVPQIPSNDYYKDTKPIKNVISEYIKRSENLLAEDRRHVHDKLVLNGSSDNVHDIDSDSGFLSVIHEAYNHHWGIKTIPDDWWYTIIRTVAIAIDENSKKNEVRSHFVNHEGKKYFHCEIVYVYFANIFLVFLGQ